MDDKRTLLDKLAIDRADDSSTPKSQIWLIRGLVLVTAILGVAVLYLLSESESRITTAEPDRQDVQSGRENKAETESSASGITDDTAITTAPAAKDTTRVLNASGYITARRMATVSAEITGRITDILVEEGMEVEEGQVLAKLDDALARIDLGLAQAQLRSARAVVDATSINLAEAERVLKRVSELTISEFSSEADLTRSEAAVAALRADLARVEADLSAANLQVRRAQERIDDHIIKAPFAGVITDKNAQPGEIVAPGSAGGGFTRTGICTIVDMNSLEIEVDVNESFIGRVHPGQAAQARLEAYPDWEIPAHVIAIIPTANRDKATVKVRLGFEENDDRILPEMGVNVAFLGE